MTITDIVIVVAIVLFLGVYVSWRAGGWTGCTPGWKRPAPPWR